MVIRTYFFMLIIVLLNKKLTQENKRYVYWFNKFVFTYF